MPSLAMLPMFMFTRTLTAYLPWRRLGIQAGLLAGLDAVPLLIATIRYILLYH